MIALGLAAVLCIAVAVMGVVLLFGNKAPAQAAVWGGTTATSFNGGSGTSASPYQIATGEQLAYLRSLINSDTNGNSAYNKSTVYYKLTANIELNNIANWTSWTSTTTGLNTWTPIGTGIQYTIGEDSYNNGFRANFDGGGFIISGIYIKTTTVSSSYYACFLGLFGQGFGTITSLGVEKSYIYYNYSTGSYVGGIIGSQSGGSIKNCYFTGTVYNNCTYSSAYAGGIAGHCSGSSSITNCYNSGTIYGGGAFTDYVGGIIGYVGSYGGMTITNCYNTGSISAQGITNAINGTNNISAGGIAGFNIAKSITNCYNTGAITVNGGANSQGTIYSSAGGITGLTRSGNSDYTVYDIIISNCYNVGSVTNSDTTSSYLRSAGGVVGYIPSNAGSKISSSSITNCYSTGTITSPSSAKGGIVGYTAFSTYPINYSYWLSGTATNAVGYGTGTVTASYTFNTSGTVTTKGGTLLAALNEWVTSNNSSLTYYYWKDTPYPTFTGNVYNTYTVTYSYNGATGNNTTTSATVTFGSSYTLVVPTRTGYTFTGWWTATSGGTQYTNASGSSLSNWSGTANITLYAQWSAVSYTVTYNNNGGGTNPTTPTSVAYDSTISLGVATNRTGYTFGGWYNETGCTTQLTSAAGAIVSGSVTNRITSGKWTPNAAFTVYAKWTANTYTLTYNYNNATGNNSTASATVTYNSSYTLVVPTRTGYAFTGWWSATSGGTQYTNASGSSLANWTGTAGITIYAQWTANTYTLTYNYNNATGNNTTTSATVTYNSSYTLVVPTRTGYTFTGWWSATSGGTQYTNASGASLANWTGTAGITIYAQWTANTYTLTYNYNNATGNNTTTSDTVTYNASYALVVPTRTGYTFTGWWSATLSGTQYTNASGVSLANWTGTAGINIYAQWTGYNYTVRFNANNGTGSTSTQSFVYGTAQALTTNSYLKEYFKFMGWATSQASADAGTVNYTNSQSVNELTTTNNATVDLYAVWSTNFATYYLYYNTGVSNEGNSGYVTPGVAIALPTAIEMAAYAPTGMTFAGWYENADLTGTAVTQVLISTAGAVKYYYAKWV